MMRLFPLVALCAAAAACTHQTLPPPVPQQAGFNAAEYTAYAKPGTGKVVGQAFAKTRSGDVKYCAGNPVTLTPVTSYSEERWERVRSGTPASALPPLDLQAKGYRHETVADGEGRFTFEQVAAGDYFVLCEVAWDVPYRGRLIRTGALVGDRVHVTDGGTTTVVLPVLAPLNPSRSTR